MSFAVVNWLHFVSLIYRKQSSPMTSLILWCCELTTFRIFDISQTVGILSGNLASLLWIDYISYLWYIANSGRSAGVYQQGVVNWLHFVSLIYRKQYEAFEDDRVFRCELTTFRIFDISQTVKSRQCLCRLRCELTTFRIFDISQTVRVCGGKHNLLLWIDYISYLWYIANSSELRLIFWCGVVNWLHFVSLIYRKQCNIRHFEGIGVVNWLHFVSLIYRKQSRTNWGAIGPKLWIDYISYLWYIANSSVLVTF